MLLNHAKEKVNQKFPESSHPVIGGSIFLRYCGREEGRRKGGERRGGEGRGG